MPTPAATVKRLSPDCDSQLWNVSVMQNSSPEKQKLQQEGGFLKLKLHWNNVQC